MKRLQEIEPEFRGVEEEDRKRRAAVAPGSDRNGKPTAFSDNGLVKKIFELRYDRRIGLKKS